MLQTFESFKTTLDVKNRLSKLIDDLLLKYFGGKPFFNALDKAFSDESNEYLIEELIKNLNNFWVCSSGGFGETLSALYDKGEFNCKGLLVFNGKMLTKNKGVTSYHPSNFEIEGKKFIFIDDSIFSGSTYQKINTFLGEYGSSIEEVRVIYDGSKVKNQIVRSLYRYWDKH